MDIRELASAIIADAQRDAARVVTQATDDVERIESETQALLRQRREAAYRAAQERYEQGVERERSRTQRDARLAVLTCKRELLDDAFGAAHERLTRLRADDRRKVLDRLLARARRELGADIGSITPTTIDAAYLKRAGRVPIKGTCDGSGGFLATSRDGKVRIDLRFDTILERVRAERGPAVAQVLFAKPAAAVPKRKVRA